jgi:hypothetical protein
MSGEQRIRAFLFYLSLISFCAGLPFILSFALGYKFNPRTLKFTKTGLIFIKTQPQGASIYLDGKLLNEKTPASLNEVLPAQYAVKLELAEHYTWFGDVFVDAGKVTYLDKIVLFPLRPNIKQLNKEEISAFWPDREKDRIYYVDYRKNVIYRSDFDGGQFRDIAVLPQKVSSLKELRVSPDKEKLMFFNDHQIVIVYLEPLKYPFVLEYPDKEIMNAFWHSDSYHMILVTDKNIEALEAKLKPATVNLTNLNKKSIEAFYDEGKNILYFLDSQKAADGRYYDNLYKLELSNKISPFLGFDQDKGQ